MPRRLRRSTGRPHTLAEICAICYFRIEGRAMRFVRMAIAASPPLLLSHHGIEGASRPIRERIGGRRSGDRSASSFESVHTQIRPGRWVEIDLEESDDGRSG
jgi:hypothetical protein